jgi:hypothetical protein
MGAAYKKRIKDIDGMLDAGAQDRINDSETSCSQLVQA